MLEVWGDTEKSVIKSQLKKTFIFIFDFFICIVSVHLVVSLKLRSLLYCVASVHALHPLLGKGKGLQASSSVHFFTYLFICIVSVHLITCTRCTRCILLIPCFVRFNIVETFA